jgi:hypothetical protein
MEAIELYLEALKNLDVGLPVAITLSLLGCYVSEPTGQIGVKS